MSEPVKVYVHLGHGYDADRWEARIVSGKLLGLNERSPYGYHLANEMHCSVTFSKDRPEGFLRKMARLSVRAVLGFDIIHAYANRSNLKEADVIWTHTESQFLALALIKKVFGRRAGWKMIGQAIWLADRWPQYTPIKRRFYLSLLKAVDVITVHSPANLEVLRELLPGRRIELVEFGISHSVSRPPMARRSMGGVINVLSLGNDEHRDWETLCAAFGSDARFNVLVVSKNFPLQLIRQHPNIAVKIPETQSGLLQFYADCDVVVVPLKKNTHASGLTVLHEGTLLGKPILCSKVGGLEHYFDDAAIAYVEPADANLLRETLLKMTSDDRILNNYAVRAREQLNARDFSSHNFIRQHVNLTNEMMSE